MNVRLIIVKLPLVFLSQNLWWANESSLVMSELNTYNMNEMMWLSVIVIIVQLCLSGVNTINTDFQVLSSIIIHRDIQLHQYWRSRIACTTVHFVPF